MGDPFSISLNIGGLIQLADLVVNKTWPFLKEAKNQRSEIAKLSCEVASLAGILHSLRLLAEGSTVPIKHDDILECQMTLEGLRDRLKKGHGTSSGKRDQVKKLVQQLCFPYERVEMQKILERLDRLKSTFNLALTAESISSQINLKADVKAVKDELFRRKALEAKIEVDEEQKKVLDFFGRVSPKENHAMSLKLRHEGTGLWLLKESRFNEWLQNCDSHIWLHGIPGAGKTVLASLVIEKVLQVCKPSEAVAFFYCDYKDTAKQDPCYILASIASQIAIQHEKAYEILEEEYKIHPATTDVKHLKPEVLVNVLKKQLRLFDFATLIIDGLDECGDNTANVLDHLVLLAQEFKLVLRLAILSRDELIIRNRLTEIDCESISIAAVSSDIRLYAASEIERRVRNGRLLVENSSTTEVILQKLIDKAQGMFRWVVCQLDFICDLTSDDECCKALDGPAPTLFDIYERLLLRLQRRPKSTQDLVKSALIWILFPVRSLSIKELCEVVTIRTGSKEKPSPVASNQIRKFCSSLIREAADGKHLEAAHFTVKEFFNNITKESHPHIAHFCLSKTEAYLEFSKVCLTYINFKDFHKPIPPFDDLLDTFVDHPFYEHAAGFWFVYAVKYWTDENVLRLAKQLFKPPMSTNFKLWRNHLIFGDDYGPELMERINLLGDSPLHWAAYLSIHQLIEWLVSHGQDVDLAAALGTPLSAAMSCEDITDRWNDDSILVPPYSELFMVYLRNNLDEGTKTCLKALIQSGARTEHIFECEIDGKAYNLSLREVLLCSGDIRLLEMESSAIEFFDEAVAARLKHVINYAVQGRYTISQDYRGRMVQMLRRMKRTYITPEFQVVFDGYVNGIEDGIEPNFENMNKIWAAAQRDQADVLESLLEEGGCIKINERDDCWDDEDDEEHHNDGKNALHWAACAGSSECIRILMDAGASIHITAKGGRTALHFAAGSLNIGAKRCIEMLAGAGLSLDAKDDEGWTALHYAAFSGSRKNVEFLLEKGLDPHLPNNSGHTAYHLAAESGSGDVPKLILEHERGGFPGCMS
ncbi:ankyrin [Hyaloscypha variabilis]